MNYGEQILIARRRKGLRQKAVAARAGINPATVIDIERERILVQEATYERLMGVIEALPPAKQVAA
ncbi:MAG: hypothetical protein BWY25_03140 [Chloroflexi bacterium ADurb.Bin222]|nr:MAG: hypothetical protein BWY25_03140 [Chloroflexi bacterium ADurb.Bin222]